MRVLLPPILEMRSVAPQWGQIGPSRPYPRLDPFVGRPRRGSAYLRELISWLCSNEISLHSLVRQVKYRLYSELGLYSANPILMTEGRLISVSRCGMGSGGRGSSFASEMRRRRPGGPSRVGPGVPMPHARPSIVGAISDPSKVAGPVTALYVENDVRPYEEIVTNGRPTGDGAEQASKHRARDAGNGGLAAIQDFEQASKPRGPRSAGPAGPRRPARPRYFRGASGLPRRSPLGRRRRNSGDGFPGPQRIRAAKRWLFAVVPAKRAGASASRDPYSAAYRECTGLSRSRGRQETLSDLSPPQPARCDIGAFADGAQLEPDRRARSPTRAWRRCRNRSRFAAMTRSRSPTAATASSMRRATTSGCSTKLLVVSTTPGMRIMSFGNGMLA